MKKVINTAASTVTFTFDGLEAVSLNIHDITAENQSYAILHGMAARIGDNAAITKSAENGFTVTEAMRRDAVLEMVNHYTSGSIEWNLKQAARKAAPQNEYILKLAAVLNMTYEECQTKLANDAIQSLTQMGR